jgi:hypothetical protein
MSLCWLGNLKGRDHFGVLGVCGRIILKQIFEKSEEKVWSELKWLRIRQAFVNTMMNSRVIKKPYIFWSAQIIISFKRDLFARISLC